MKELQITVPSVEATSYKVTIGSGILSDFWEWLGSWFGDKQKFIITDSNLCSAGHLKTLLGQMDIPVFAIEPPGEVSKNMNTLVSVIETMEKASLGRDAVVIALGGGTVGDIAGFAAAIFKRGVPIIHIPTTTVAQADSSIGGKTGVDSSKSKNAFGAFWQPVGVYIDVETLKTLDDREFKAGLVESVKHALIADGQYLNFLEDNLAAILARDTAILEETAFRNCKIKASVVETDPTEENQRRILNYGHTIGHAVESASSYELLHGEAVAIGIMGAGLLEIELGLSDRSRLQRISEIFKKLEVPLKIPQNLTVQNLIELIRFDKKAVNKWPRFVLLDDIGNVHRKEGQWAVEVEQKLVEKVLIDLQN